MRFRRLLSEIVLASFLTLAPQYVAADTIYYGGSIKNKEKPAYIIYDKVKIESRYHQELPSKNDPDYDKILQKRNNSVKKAIKQVAKEEGYDVVVEKNDPEIKGYTDISALVIEQLKENEK